MGIGEETTYGTAANLSKFLDIVSEDLNPAQNIIYAELVDSRDLRKYAPGGYGISGGVEMFGEPENISNILKWTLGEVTTTTVATGVYEHTFKGADSISSFTAEIGLDDIAARRVVGCAIDSLSLESVKNELLSASLDIVGQKDSLVTATTPTFSALNPFVFHQGTVKIAGTTATGRVEALRLDIGNNVFDDIFTLGSRFLPRLEIGRREMTGSMDLSFIDTEHIKRFFGSAAATEPLDSLNTLALNALFKSSIITGTYSYELELDIPKVLFDTSKVNIDRRERIVQAIEYTVLYDSVSAYALKARLRNAESSI